MSEMAYEFDEILEQIHHTLKTDDKQQFKEIFLENHTYDQAQIYLSLSEEQRQLVYQYLSPEDMAPVKLLKKMLKMWKNIFEKWMSDMLQECWQKCMLIMQ